MYDFPVTQFIFKMYIYITINCLAYFQFKNV